MGGGVVYKVPIALYLHLLHLLHQGGPSIDTILHLLYYHLLHLLHQKGPSIKTVPHALYLHLLHQWGWGEGEARY